MDISCWPAGRINDFWVALLWVLADELASFVVSGAAMMGLVNDSATSARPSGLSEFEIMPWGRGEIRDPVGRLE